MEIDDSERDIREVMEDMQRGYFSENEFRYYVAHLDTIPVGF